MKKITSIALATCMVGSLFAFSACGNGSTSGAVKGDYTEVTAENKEQVVQDIVAFEANVGQVNSGGLVGDMSKATWRLGTTYATNLTMSYNMEGLAKGEAKISSDMAVALSKGADGFVVKGSAKEDFALKTTIKTEEGDNVTDAKVGLQAYLTDDWAYAELNASGKVLNETLDESWKSIAGKVSFEALAEVLEGYIDLDEFDVSDLGQYTSNVSFSGIVAMLQEAEIPVSYELSEKSGLKLKISLTKEWIESMMEEPTEEVSVASSFDGLPGLGGIGGVPQMPTLPTIPDFDIPEIEMPEISEDDTITFKTCKLDYYLVISEKGLLKQVSMDANVEATLPDETDSGKSYLKVKGSVVLKADTTVKVTIPADIKTDTKYTDYSFFLGAMY